MSPKVIVLGRVVHPRTGFAYVWHLPNGLPPLHPLGSKNIFRNKNRIFSFTQTRDMVYVRSIKRKERVYNKFGWVLKIDIGKSQNF